MDNYVILFYYNKKRCKHKLYATKKAYEIYWAYHVNQRILYLSSFPWGLIGFINGKIDRTWGEIPT